MKKTSIYKRLLSVLVALALIAACALTTLAGGSMTAFNGDSSTGTQQIKVTSNGGTVSLKAGTRVYSVPAQLMTSLRVGTLVTATASDNDTRTFMFWSDEYANRVYSYDRTIQFTVASRMHLRAQYATVSDTQHYVTFVNYGGTKMFSSDSMVDHGTALVAPAAPKVPGLTFKKWSMTNEQVKNSTEDIVVYPMYDVNVESYEVTITNEKGVSGAGTYSNYETVNLKADPVNGAGESFSYWEDGDGNIVSYVRDYSFRINYNVTLTAVYGASETAVPVIRITNIVRDAGDEKITFFAERSVPEEYTVISHGMLMNTSYDAPTEKQMAVGSAGDVASSTVRKAYGKSNENCGTFSLAKANIGLEDKVNARPFVIVANAAGAQSIVYGDIVQATFND